jgi:hypothetical protein
LFFFHIVANINFFKLFESKLFFVYNSRSPQFSNGCSLIRSSKPNLTAISTWIFKKCVILTLTIAQGKIALNKITTHFEIKNKMWFA